MSDPEKTPSDAFIGIDIGGTESKFGIVDPAGQVMASDTMPTHADKPAEAFFERLCERLMAMREALSDPVSIRGVGVGAPNANFYTGKIETPPNLSWGTVDVKTIIQSRIDAPVAVTNDANATAIGEMRFGAAGGMKNFILITLGTGLGSGFVVNGELVCGHDGFAGEMGHVTAIPGGRKCGCGKRGCLETYASATGLTRTALELMATETSRSPLRGVRPSDLTSKKVYEAARDGDALAMIAFERTAAILGRALADAVALFSPEAIILFGGLTNAGDLLFGPTQSRMEENLFPVFRGKVRLLRTQLPQGRAAILGAAALAMETLEKRPWPPDAENNG